MACASTDTVFANTHRDMASNSQRQHHERSPLLIAQGTPSSIANDNNDDERSSSSTTTTASSSLIIESAEQHLQDTAASGQAGTSAGTSHGGTASFVETVINLMKTCMGSGCLALPYAAQQGGLLLFIFGTFSIAVWNMYSVTRLCQCGDITRVSKHHHQHHHHAHGHRSSTTTIPKDAAAAAASLSLSNSIDSSSSSPPPPPGTASLGKVAWYALGPFGLLIVDFLMLMLLFGVVIAYQDAIQSFLQDTQIFTTGYKAIDAMIVAMMVAPLCIVPDLGYLSKASAFGLTVLGLAIMVIAAYGIFYYGDDIATTTTVGVTVATTSSATSLFGLTWLPTNGITGISHWFGCLVFGFGAVPLTFNFQESMSQPTKMIQANTYAMLGVSIIYVIIGIGLSIFYPDIPGDVLHELPSKGIIPTVTRLAFVVVILATTPLLIVPCGELIEGKILGDTTTHHGTASTIAAGYNPNIVKIIVRFGISFFTAGISVAIPGFVEALSFVGCFCVALVSFCIPPLLHFVLLHRKRSSSHRGEGVRRLTRINSTWVMYWIDAIMLAWGLAATCITSITTLHKMTATEST